MLSHLIQLLRNPTMADKMRWRYGDTNPVVAQPLAEDVIEIGDLLYQASGYARPASALKHEDRSARDLPRLFVAEFLGVAMQRSRCGDIDSIRVATTGVFEFPGLVVREWELGDLVGPVIDMSLHLADQDVRHVGSNHEAIGRCAKRGRQLTDVLVDIRSAVMTGGVVGRMGGSGCVQ
jgi:hypothetical protein